MFTFTHRNPEMQLDKKHTALVLADMQNEFLEEKAGTAECLRTSFGRCPCCLQRVINSTRSPWYSSVTSSKYTKAYPVACSCFDGFLLITTLQTKGCASGPAKN